MPLNRVQVIKAVGDADDATVAELIATGATVEELAEAQAWLANDEPLVNTGNPLPGGRISRLAEILARCAEEHGENPQDAGASVAS